ncbi:pimeloyl-ACP methyl ester carboxylesterase [Nonomuraea thailandensis]|uniref:Pimeloyl-ACP methyl ester carboxylesterase n=1 Tax=Nonomuraea thailandensis TaxID=1188745 RepID=A0A9X2GEZ5_9ACTN|nr:alpha/beta hydrolase [Nonomuraea thailandensis]MCP2356465.1 pimeloyl-ACP methyl ester carboxylesterase [Nonomuraea thailandensis]
MPFFSAHDGTRLAYHLFGEGEGDGEGDGDPLICLPGGPMQDSGYLGDLGGLSEHRRLVLMDPRGTGESDEPRDPATYRCDRLVGDVEALREHLGLDRIDLLGHSAGANLAVLYATRHPHRTGRLLLIAPSTRAVGLDPTPQARLEAARLRAGEPWFPEAFAALRQIQGGQATAETWAAVDPFMFGRWDEAAQAFQALCERRRNDEAAAVYGAEGAYDPEATRAALAAFGAPVLLLAGELDLNTPPGAAAEYAALFPRAEFVVQPGAGHSPWIDDAGPFVTAIATFLDRTS